MKSAPERSEERLVLLGLLLRPVTVLPLYGNEQVDSEVKVARSSRWVVGLSVIVCLASAGCTATAQGEAASTPTSDHTPTDSAPESPSPTLADPLDRLTDPSSDDFVGSDVQTVLNENGHGSAIFEVQRPKSFVKELRFFVACTGGEFTVTLGTFYSGQCAPDFASSGSIPVPPGEDPLEVELDVPADVDYRIVAIPVQ
jgi:hypothetical protein